MPTKHTKCSASSAYRWIHCPGSIPLSDHCPTPPPSEYAEEGTLAHSLGELKLRLLLGEITGSKYEKKLSKIKGSRYFNGEMDEATNFYSATVWEEFIAAGEGAVLMVEQRLSMTKWIPEGFGTGDALILSPKFKYIQVIDLKYGNGS